MKPTIKRVVCYIVIFILLPGITLIYSRTGSPYQEKALQAGHWITTAAIKIPNGSQVWLANPMALHSINNTLYSGNPGVILFFIEAYYATGQKQYLDEAAEGANYLLGALENEKEMGFYEGISGIGFALEYAFKATGKEKYRDGVNRCLSLIRQGAKQEGKGIRWNTGMDVIYGSAGTGLFLLYMAKELKDPTLVDLAVQAGNRLLELGVPAAKGLKWAVNTDSPTLMPNFSHGTAGIAYFLASLYKDTGKKEFLDDALAGASYLLSIAKTDNDTCLIFHHEPGGEDLYYLGWCHGPVGTARLFYRLFEVTGDKTWMEWVKKSACGILQSGIPGIQTPGFWNNVGRCCGLTGVAEFFLDLYRVTREKTYITFSKQVTAQLLEKATPGEKGLKWMNAEYRVRPDYIRAQTGLMQGAAGIGLWLLKMDAFTRGKKEKVLFPDSPF